MHVVLIDGSGRSGNRVIDMLAAVVVLPSPSSSSSS